MTKNKIYKFKKADIENYHFMNMLTHLCEIEYIYNIKFFKQIAFKYNFVNTQEQMDSLIQEFKDYLRYDFKHKVLLVSNANVKNIYKYSIQNKALIIDSQNFLYPHKEKIVPLVKKPLKSKIYIIEEH